MGKGATAAGESGQVIPAREDGAFLKRGRRCFALMGLPMLASAVAFLLAGCAISHQSASLHEPRFIKMWGGKGTNDGEFTSPIGIAIGPRDEVFVAEFNASRVQRFTAEGRFLGRFPVLKNPGGIAVDGAGSCYVTSMTEHKLAVYDSTGRALGEWGTKKDSADGEFNQPGGVAVGPDGSIYVADQGNHRVQWFSPGGKFLGKFGGYGSEPGKFGGADKPGSRFGGPQFLAFDTGGNIYTTEAAAGRIQKLGPTGKPLAFWGSNRAEPGGFGGRDKTARTPIPGPIGVWVDRRGRVWVSATNDRIQLFSSNGKFLLAMGGTGALPGQFHLPHGLARDRKGFMYVVDASNQRIQKFAP